jgi:hypothetical protein
MDGDLRDVIHDGWGRQPAFAMYADRRIMDLDASRQGKDYSNNLNAAFY